MTATKTGKIAKFTSSSAFTITVSGKTYVVKTERHDPRDHRLQGLEGLGTQEG